MLAMTGNSLTQRPLIELRTLYQKSPRTRDVIVEGRDDARLVSWYLTERGLDALTIAVDDRAVVPSDLVIRSGGEVGPRGRVIALAREVDDWELTEPSISCVIDLDRDPLEKKLPERGGSLIVTDFGTMEVYMFQDRPFNQFLRVVLGRNDDAEALREKTLPALNDLYLVRAALHWSGMGIALVRDIATSCAPDGDYLTLNAEDLLSRSLQGSDKERISDLLAEVARLRKFLPENRLRAVRGHDMSPVIIRALGLRNVWARQDAFESAWRGCLQASDLDAFDLFRTLRSRVGIKLNI